MRVLRPPVEGHPSDYVIHDLVDVSVRHGVPEMRAPIRLGKAAARLGVRPPSLSSRPILVPTMGERYFLLYAAAWRGVPVPFAWDIWQPAWERWIRHLTILQPPLMIATAPGSRDYLGDRLPKTTVICLPEAADVSRYRSGPDLSERTIDVLELGRRHEGWHRAVSGPAVEAGLRHVYERRKGELIFPDQDSLVRGLSAARISVCFPSSDTSPERSGSVATLTHRYLESIASRCLVLGRAPQQLVDLFGFDPVVAADLTDPWPQVRDIVADISRYQPLVDRAHERLRAVGSWDIRVRELLIQIDRVL